MEDSLFKKSLPIPQPTDAQLDAEEKEIAPYLTFTIRDEAGNVVRKIKTETGKGVRTNKLGSETGNAGKCSACRIRK